MAKGELDSLRSLLNKNPADPLEQSIFEKGPEVGFAIPAMPILTPQEGQTILPGVIASVDPGIAWDALGAQAFKIGGDLFGDTLDYLIDSKANALADLSDMYKSRLDTAYTNLSKKSKKPGSFTDDTALAKKGGMSWSDAKSRPTAANDIVTDGILDEISAIKSEWRDKANTVLENGKGNWYTPAIDYWDENLPMNMNKLGTKYQQLAVSARRADRSIMDQAEKLLFESQFANPTGKSGTTDSVNTKFLAGLLPIMTAEDAGLRADGTKRFHTVDPTNGMETPIMVNGLPLVVKDEEGNTRFNPQLYSISPQVVFNAIDNEDDFKYYIGLEQDTTDTSAIASFDGTLTPEYTKIIQDILSRPQSTRSPMDMWKVGAVFAKLPPEAIANFARNNKMSQTESDQLMITVDAARMGYGSDELTKFRTISTEDLSESRKIWGVLTDMQLATNSGTMAAGDTSIQVQTFANKVAVPIIGSLLGLSEEEQTQYTISRTADNRLYDDQPGANLATLLSRNQLLQVPVIKALAYFKANPLLLVDEKGKPRSDEQIKKSVAQYIETETTRAGIVTIIDPDTKQPVSFYNRDMTWVKPILKDQEKNLPAFMSVPASNLYRGNARETPAEIDFAMAKNVFGRSIDRSIFNAIYANMATVVTDTDGIETSYAGLPMAEALRLGAACNPDVWRKYGWDGSEATKLNAAMAALADIKPASEWGIKADLTGRYDAFSSTQRGGIALGFNAIPTVSKGDLFDAVINRQRMSLTGPLFTPENGNTGTPALFIPASPPESDKFLEKLFKAKLARESNNPMYTTVTGDSIPDTRVQPLSSILPQVTGLASIPELAQTFSYIENEQIETADDAYTFLNLNQRAILSVVKNNPEYKQGVGLMFAEFDKGPAERKFFTPQNMALLVNTAKEKGYTNALDFTSFVLAAAQAQATNKKTMLAKDPRRVAQVQIYLESKGSTAKITEDAFFVPEAEGVVLYKQGTPEFFAGIKKYANEGYDVYTSNIDQQTYFLRKPEQTLDRDYTLVLPGRTPNELEADYNTKYSQVFGQREGDLKKSQEIKDSVQKIFAPVKEPSFIQTKVEKPMVLPSEMVDGFKAAMSNFEYRNRIGFGNNTDTMNELYDTMLFYDLPKLYYETGTLDYTISELPEKYRLPGHSKYPKPVTIRPSGVGMHTFTEIGGGLRDAFNAVLSLDSRLQETTKGDQAIETMVKESQKKYEFQQRSEKIGDAIKKGDLNYILADLFEEPVSRLRMQDKELTERLNQDSLNFLGLALEKDTEKVPSFPEGVNSAYGIDRDTYYKAFDFRGYGWTPEQFEYQIRAAVSNSNIKTGGVDINGVVSQLDPKQFIMDSKLTEQLKRDIQFSMPKEPLPGLTQAESDRQRAADLKARLNDPTQLVDIKKQYLIYSLTPGIRVRSKSKNRAKIDALAKLYWTTYDK